jgi:serine/threonine protein kinase/uncharacterized protein (DUF433 family)
MGLGDPSAGKRPPVDTGIDATLVACDSAATGATGTQIAPAAAQHVPIPGYTLLGKLEEGAGSVVYRALQESTGRTVALRLIGQEVWRNSSIRRRLEHQASELAALDRDLTTEGTPANSQILDHGVTDDRQQFIVTELVAGRPVDEWIEQLLVEGEASSTAAPTVEEGPAQNTGDETVVAQPAAEGGPDQITRGYKPEDRGGVLFIDGTNVSLAAVVVAHHQGRTPEAIRREFPELSLEQVYGTIAYYLGHRSQVERYLNHRMQEPDRPALPGPVASGGRVDNATTVMQVKAGRVGPATSDTGATILSESKHGGPRTDETVVAEPSRSKPSGSRSGAGTGAASGSRMGSSAAPAASAAKASPSRAPGEEASPGVQALSGSKSSSGSKASSKPASKPSEAWVGTSEGVVPLGESPPHPDPTLGRIEADKKLGPYELVGRLGEGAMGAVYLARQVSLDRKVAVKVLNSRLSQDAGFVARFTREAYAAAQLSHHNIVQIHDIGEDDLVHFFSMEFVAGKTLNGLLKDGGRVEPALAANYILQAARGLKFAHDHAMIHRDIKPHNLMVNEHGIVKVVDLGLVKRQGAAGDDEGSSLLDQASDASATGAARAMGTPAYMAPEQAQDAASVDGRADIYSLGCALYDLLTGRPPFTGNTAVEVMTKHATEAVTPPEKIVADVPKTLSAILMKMIAKRPDDRYASMDEVVEALEGYLATTTGRTAGPFLPEDHHLDAMEVSVEQFNSISWDYLRKAAILTFFGVGGVGLLATVWGSHFKGLLRVLWEIHIKIAEGMFGLMVLTFLCYMLISSFSTRSYLTMRVRRYVSSFGALAYIKGGLAAVVIVGLLSAFHLNLVWLVTLAVAFAIAFAFHCTIDRALHKERRAALQQLEAMLKTMRQQGMDEDALRLFVCENAGPRWEEIYTSLFGHEAQISGKLKRMIEERGLGHRKWGAIANPIINAIDAKLRRQEDRRQVQYFARIEERKLRAQGMETAQARAEALRVAETIVAKARRMKDAIEEGKTSTGRGAKTLLTAGTGAPAAPYERESRTRELLTGVLSMGLGPQVRLIAGLLMLAVFCLWLKVDYPTLPTLIYQKVHQVVHPDSKGQFQAQTDARTANPAAHDQLTADNARVKSVNDKAAEVAHIGQRGRNWLARAENLLFRVAGTWQGGLAGVLLVMSSLFPRLRVGVTMFASTVLILMAGRFGHFPTFGVLSPQVSLAILGTALALAAFVFGRQKRWRRRPRRKVTTAVPEQAQV